MRKLLAFLFLPVALVFGQTATRTSALSGKYSTWRDYGGTPDAAQYSSLRQINRLNVNQLEIAWIYPTGDDTKYSFNPLAVDDTVYVLAKSNSIVALDAKTGAERWVHSTDPHTKLITNRGINYWESKDRAERRLFYADNNLLHALDAHTGELIRSFGQNGSVDLREGLDRDPKSVLLAQSTTPGRVFENLLILGSATNQEYESAPGDVRAYDVRSGKLVWTFHTVPRPGEFGYETWPADAWKTVGGADAWGELSLDVSQGVIFIPTASPKYNFYGANRKGANLFGDCLLALDARTGKRLWHYQMVHHDIWDYDDATAPKLLTLQHNGASVEAVAQAGKQGFVWVFDRTNGKPLWPIDERAVPHSDVPGEETWPTQPFPTWPPPFARQKFTPGDLSPFIESPEERARFRDQLLSARNEGLFTPPSLRNTVQMPGNNGGANWGSAAVDPTTGMLYVVSKDLPAMLKLQSDKATDETRRRATPTAAWDDKVTHYRSTFGFMVTKDGLSPLAPPWTSLTAYDLNSGEIKWKTPLGEVPELAAKGVKNTGSFYPKVGPVVTAGGLIFTGTRDRKVRALDQSNGKILWEKKVDAALEGMPAIFEVAGREYIIFCAAAPDRMNLPGSAVKAPAFDQPRKAAYIAFALPEQPKGKMTWNKKFSSKKEAPAGEGF